MTNLYYKGRQLLTHACEPSTYWPKPVHMPDHASTKMASSPYPPIGSLSPKDKTRGPKRSKKTMREKFPSTTLAYANVHEASKCKGDTPSLRVWLTRSASPANHAPNVPG